MFLTPTPQGNLKMAKLRDAAETLGGCLLYAAFLSIPIILILAFVKRSTRMTIRKRGARYHYDFMIRWQRYRGALPEARTKAEAQQAEAKIKNKIYERKYGKTSASRFVC